MPRLKKLTDYTYSPTNPSSEDAIRTQIDDSIQEVYDASPRAGDTVNLTGNQTISDVKTFSSSPIVPTPTSASQVANKSYVDGVAISATIPLDSLTDDYLSSAPGNIKPRFSNFQSDYEYQTPTVVGQQIRISKLGASLISKFYLSTPVTGGAITISTDGGATSTPLREEDGITAVTSIDIGLYEVVYATSFFILKSKGVKEAIYGKRNGTEITLIDSKGENVKIKQNEYVYMNETVQLILDSPTDTVYDRTIPVQVVNAAYDTSGNGGRRVLLINGNYFSLVTDSFNLKLYKNQTLIWSTSGYSSGGSGSMCTDGSNIFVLLIVNNTARHFKINLDGTGEVLTQIDSGFTSQGTGSLTIDSNGHLHAAWASKNATYPNSFNIRYSKSTDGGVTWASPTQVSNHNVSGTDRTQPSIVISQDGYPIILHTYIVGTTHSISYYKFNGSVWGQSTVYSVSTHTQSNPSATADLNGVIHVTWHGKDSTDTTRDNIRYSKSSDNGVTWSAMSKLTSGNTVDRRNPSIATDLALGIYIAYEDNGTLKYLKGNGSWGSPVTITTGTNASVCDNYKNFENPITLFDGGSDVKFYGKWTESNSPQIIPSLATATAESELQAIGDGTLKSFSPINKFYVGYHSKVSNGFTPL